MQVVVVGAGLGGLSAACHLRGAGHDVLVVEREDRPGGRAGRIERQGFAFDTGPTVLTMVDLVEDCFRAVGADLADHLSLRPVDPMYRACYADGSTLRVRHDQDRMAAEIADVCGDAEAVSFGRFVTWLDELYRLEMPNFIDRNFDSPLDLAWPLGPALRLVRAGAFRKLGKVVASYFDDDRLQRIFSFQAMYAGLAPYEALAVYCVITYMDSVRGVYAADGGMHAVPAAIAAAAAKAGVDFRYDTAVERIVLDEGTSGRVRGVRLDGGELVVADAVVCNPDLPVAYRTLLPGLPMPRAARQGSYSPSCLVWHVGVRGVPPADIGHHNIHFGHQWDESFKALLHDGTRMPDPSILVTVPSRDDPTLAPDGCSVLYVLEPAPNLDGVVDWTTERGRARDDLARKVAGSRLPARHRHRGAGRPPRLGATGHGAGHALRPLPRLLPDRTVPAGQRGQAGTRPGVRGLGHRPRRRRADGAGVGPPGRRAGVGAGPVSAALTLDASYARCRALNKRHGTTYYWSTFALPRVKRHHVHALYGFCRYADDIVDDLGPAPVAERERALTDFGDRFFADLAVGGSDDPVLKAVVHTVQAFGIDPDCFRRFLRSMAMDLTVDRYPTYADLQRYMDGSAAVIGEMMLPILEPSDPAVARQPARDLGDGFQLTNFLRDVDEDLDRGRVYLPWEDVERFDAVDALEHRKVTDGFVALLRFEIDRTRSLYRRADEGMGFLPASSARCIRAARRLYSEILDVIEANDYDVFSERARVPTWRKALVVARSSVA